MARTNDPEISSELSHIFDSILLLIARERVLEWNFVLLSSPFLSFLFSFSPDADTIVTVWVFSVAVRFLMGDLNRL